MAVSIKLTGLDETLPLPGWGWWLSAVCTLEEDAKGRMVARRDPQGTLRRRGKGPQLASGARSANPDRYLRREGFDLSRYKSSPPRPLNMANTPGRGEFVNQRTMPVFVQGSYRRRRARNGLNGCFSAQRVCFTRFCLAREITRLLQAATYGEPLQPGEIKKRRTVSRRAWKPGEPPCGKNTARPTRNSISSFARL